MSATAPVIFLDIDGVLVTRESMKEGGFRSPDRRCVERLNELIETTRAEIVISSSWRIGYSLDFIRGAFCARGFRHPASIIDRTPQIHWRKNGNDLIVGSAARADEIRAWLAANPRETFVILDDDLDAEIEGRYVRTSMDDGLCDTHAAAALRILSASVGEDGQ